MIFPQPMGKEEPEQTLPLINVAFLILIFFMLAGVLEQPDLFQVNPPESPGPDARKSDLPTILVSSEGRLAVGEMEIEPSELGSLMIFALSEAEQQVVYVKADAALEMQRLIGIMEILETAGAESIVLLTIEAER